MQTLNEYLVNKHVKGFKEYSFIEKICDELNADGKLDILKGYKTELCMPSFTDLKEDTPVRTLSVTFYKFNPNKPDYIFALWGGGKGYGEMSALREIINAVNDDTDTKFTKGNTDDTFNFEYDNSYWTIKVFNGEDIEIKYIDR